MDKEIIIIYILSMFFLIKTFCTKLHFNTANLKMKPNERCTIKTEGILRKWEEHLQITEELGDFICTGMIYYYDEKGREHWIDIIENIIVNRKTMSSGTKLIICYNPKNPDEAYIQIEEKYLKLANRIFYNMIKRVLCIAIVVFVCLLCTAKRPASIIKLYFLETGRGSWSQVSPIRFAIVILAATVLLTDLISIILVNIDRKILRQKFKNSCTVKVNGTLKNWEKHRIFNKDVFRPNISVSYMAILSYKDESGKEWIVNVQGKDKFLKGKVKIGSKIPLFINPHNKLDACIDYQSFLKRN